MACGKLCHSGTFGVSQPSDHEQATQVHRRRAPEHLIGEQLYAVPEDA